MKRTIAACFALVAFAITPAHGQEAIDSKVCFQRCMETFTVENAKKSGYDADAVNNDPGKSEAEKQRSHKKAIAGVCRNVCAE